MTTYPGAIDEFRVTQNLPGILYDAADTKTVYAEDTNNHSDAIVAIETELGTNPSGASATVVDRLNGIDTTLSGKENSLGFTPENAANKSTSTSLGTSNTLYPTQNAVKSYIDAAISAAKQALYPVGSIWTSTSVSTSPATVLGFGTWSVFGAGRVLVSKAASGTFGTIGATGGAETHTLTTGEIPSHNHGSTTNTMYYVGSGGQFNAPGGSNMNTNNSATSGNTGGGGSHNNLQPYIVVYMWERTA